MPAVGLITGGINHPNFGCLNFFITSDALWGCDIPILLPLTIPRLCSTADAGRDFYSRNHKDTSPEMPDFQETKRNVGGRWWFRTADLHDVNVALYP